MNWSNETQSSFESNRDIYICGDSNEQAFEAATQLQSAGFERVSTIDGGLPAWKAIGGSIEGQTNAGPTRGQLLP
ncbi:MAG: hypothetical protein HC800_09975 [Phormidesmis sp. RL_2_1]|nr:hypothetical protein [Phormidesmis sp. RL_2_1]